VRKKKYQYGILPSPFPHSCSSLHISPFSFFMCLPSTKVSLTPPQIHLGPQDLRTAVFQACIASGHSPADKQFLVHSEFKISLRAIVLLQKFLDNQKTKFCKNQGRCPWPWSVWSLSRLVSMLLHLRACGFKFIVE